MQARSIERRSTHEKPPDPSRDDREICCWDAGLDLAWERCISQSCVALPCYFLVGDSIKAAENTEAADDATALLSAEKLILKSEFLAVEVWQEKNFIGRISIAPDLKVIVGGKDETGP